MKTTELLDQLFPITRSITGNGVRETLSILNEMVPIQQREYATGTKCFDWIVPKEWNIYDAYIKDLNGKKIVDFHDNNLHVVSYSTPVNKRITKKELLDHIHTLPELPDAIPYVTSYYEERWGFCLEHKRLLGCFNDNEYEVVIDSSLKDGSLTIGEGFIKGETSQEVLLSTYICHPSMANNELSGPIVQTFLYKHLLKKKNLKYSYRFLYLPETIGPIAYLSDKGDELKKNVIAGFVLTCLGISDKFRYKKSRRGDSLADRSALNVLAATGQKYEVIDFFPGGSDERQYCSIGFNLPVGSLMRSMYGSYKEYHTSLDNKELVSKEALDESIEMYIKTIEAIEVNDVYINTNPYCETHLSKRGLMPTLGAKREVSISTKIFKWLLGYSDGDHDIIAIADKLNMPAGELKTEIERLKEFSLLKKREPDDKRSASDFG